MEQSTFMVGSCIVKQCIRSRLMSQSSFVILQGPLSKRIRKYDEVPPEDAEHDAVQ